MPAERYGFEVSAWVQPEHYAALRDDVNRAVGEAVTKERERCAKIAEAMADSALRNNDGWLGHRMIPLEIAKRIRSHT